MSTYNKENNTSAIPRAIRAALSAAIGPRPTKASLLRASQVKQDLTGGCPAEKRKAVVIQQGSEIRKIGIRMGRQMGRKGIAEMAGKKVGGSVRGAVGELGAIGGNKGKMTKGVAAPVAKEVVSCYEASVKKADSALQPKKKVRFTAEPDRVRVFKTTAGEKAPWRLKKGEKQEFWEGEQDWEYLQALQQYNGEYGGRFVDKAKAWLEEIEDPNETGDMGYCECLLVYRSKT
jgi:hypothetical protein